MWTSKVIFLCSVLIDEHFPSVCVQFAFAKQFLCLKTQKSLLVRGSSDSLTAVLFNLIIPPRNSREVLSTTRGRKKQIR